MAYWIRPTYVNHPNPSSKAEKCCSHVHLSKVTCTRCKPVDLTTSAFHPMIQFSFRVEGVRPSHRLSKSMARRIFSGDIDCHTSRRLTLLAHCQTASTETILFRCRTYLMDWTAHAQCLPVVTYATDIFSPVIMFKVI